MKEFGKWFAVVGLAAVAAWLEIKGYKTAGIWLGIILIALAA